MGLSGICLFMGGFFVAAAFAADEQQSQGLNVEMTYGRLMQDVNGAPTIFPEKPIPVRVFLAASHEALRNKAVWANVCEAYEVMVLVDGKEAPPEAFTLNRRTILQEPLSWCVVDIMPASGLWPTGALIIGGSLNQAILRQSQGSAVQLLGEDQPIRLVSRPIASADDERLRLRYDVARYANDEQCLAWEPDRALEAVEKLNARFPDDPYGHAYAGLLYEIYFRDLDLALSHYQKALERITKTLPPLALEGDKPLSPTKEFLDLRFDAWMGAKGALELVHLLRGKIRRLEAQIKPPTQ
jgi:tetratricopeptide (TPR) repeat protein